MNVMHCRLQQQQELHWRNTSMRTLMIQMLTLASNLFSSALDVHGYTSQSDQELGPVSEHQMPRKSAEEIISFSCTFTKLQIVYYS